MAQGNSLAGAWGTSTQPKPNSIRWQPDSSLPTGGYFVNIETGQPLTPGVGTPIPPNSVYDPATGRFGAAAGAPAAAATTAPATTTPAPGPNDALLAQWIAKHGALQGGPFVTNPKIKNSSGVPGEDTEIDNPDPTHRYTFADGSTLEVTKSGGVVKASEVKKTADDGPGRVVGGILYEPDPDNPGGPWIAKTPTTGPETPGQAATAEGTKLDNQLKQALINQRARNEAAGKGYATDDELRIWADAAQKAGLSADSTAAQVARLANQNKNDDIKMVNDTKTTNAGVGLTNATTARVGAETTQIGAATDKTRAEIEALGQKTPADVDYTKAQTAKTLAELNNPQAAAVDTTAEFTATRNPQTGQITYSRNENYQPKDVAGQIVNLQNQAQRKRDELNQQLVAGKLTGEQATTLFNSWWDQTVEPRRAGIQQAQDQVRFENQIKASGEQRAAYQAANLAGGQAIDAYQAQAKNRVGPGYAGAMQSILDAYKNGTTVGPIDAKGLVWEAPDMAQLAQKATQDALKTISPFAAAQTGNPGGGGLQVPGGMDLSSGLDRTRYGFGGGPTGVPVAAGGGGATPPVVAGGGGGVVTAAAPAAAAAAAATPDWYTEWRKRQDADVALQRQQAGIGNYVFGG